MLYCASTRLLCELCLWLRYALDSQIFRRSELTVICCSKPNDWNADFVQQNISIMQNTELSFVFMQNHSHLGSCLSWVAWNNLFCNDNPSFAFSVFPNMANPSLTDAVHFKSGLNLVWPLFLRYHFYSTQVGCGWNFQCLESVLCHEKSNLPNILSAFIKLFLNMILCLILSVCVLLFE